MPYLSAAPKSDVSPRVVVVTSDVYFFLSKLEEANHEHILGAMNDPELADMKNRYYASKRELTAIFTQTFFHISISSAERLLYESRRLTPTSIKPHHGHLRQSRLLQDSGMRLRPERLK